MGATAATLHDARELEAVAASVARASAALIRANIGRATRLGEKSSPTDVVTRTDLDAEQLIRGMLADSTPGVGVLGEEGGQTLTSVGGEAGRLQWVVDPLDGTVNFLYSLPVIGVSVAAALDGEVVAGAVVDVLRDETFSAAAGHGARLGGSPIGVSQCRSLSQALVLTGFSYRADIRGRQGRIVGSLLPAARDIRCFGSAALQLCWVGAGRADAYFERDIKVWDYSAGALVAREAGAVTELPCPENEGLVIAAPPAVFEELRAVVDRR
ncbi:MAG: inositol monophosphatase family protein [Acidimicrobiales bacterium]